MAITSTILHIPHTSRNIPENIRRKIVIDDDDLELELNRLTDHYTDELFILPGAEQLVFPVSRLVVDPERFVDDEKEPMAKRGQGVIYTGKTDFGVLRDPPSDNERQVLLNTYYWPHHKRLDELVSSALEKNNRVLIIDCHSFPNIPLPVDLNQDPVRPDICIGSDSFHTPDDLIHSAIEYCESTHWTVRTNNPYAGTIVPLKYFGRDSRVTSIMIEINRRLYLKNDPRDIIPSDEWSDVCEKVSQLLLALITNFNK